MLSLLALAAGALAAANVVLVVVLVLRRLRLARLERVRVALEDQLRPLALRIADGDDGVASAPPPGGAEARVLAALLARYARRLHGTGRERIGAYFDAHGAVAGRARRHGLAGGAARAARGARRCRPRGASDGSAGAS